MKGTLHTSQSTSKVNEYVSTMEGVQDLSQSCSFLYLQFWMKRMKMWNLQQYINWDPE